MIVHIKSLHFYPIKSLSGIEIEQVQLAPTGFYLDRKWMIVDASNIFITQRNFPVMALIETAVENDSIVLSYKGESMHIPIDIAAYHSPRTCTVWKDESVGLRLNEEVDDWLSEIIGKQVHLVRQSEESDRLSKEQRVTFADSSQMLLIGTASLDHLNAKLSSPIKMNRFRPNIVVETQHPHIEDEWKAISIAGTTLGQTKLCSRCRIITTDQTTGEIDPEPLSVLADYRRINKKIMFGSFYHFTDEPPKTFTKGDKIDILASDHNLR